MNKLFIKEYYIHCYEKEEIEENTILIVSGRNFVPKPDNMISILSKLCDEEYMKFRIYLCCTNEDIMRRGKVFSGYNANIKTIRYNGKEHIKRLATAKYLIMSTPIDEWFIKKDGQIIFNIWYENPLEKTVKTASDCIYDYGCIQKNIAFADYIIASDALKFKELAETFGAKNLSAGKIFNWDGLSGLADALNLIFLGGHSLIKQPVNCNDDDKENVIIYVSELQLNGITSALLNVLSNLDREKRNYYAFVLTEEIGKHTERLYKLPDGVQVIPVSVRPVTRLHEYVALKLHYKLNLNKPFIMRTVDKVYEREVKRYFGGFVYSHVIQYIGYQRDVINLFGKMHCNRVVFVHNDMTQELKMKKNQHELTLRKAYACYDHVAAVSKDIYPTLFELGATKDNAAIVNNCIDYNGILERGFGEIEFEKSTVSNVSLERLKEILDGTAVKFINIARFSPEKGHIMLMDAFERYYKDDKNSFLIIIGGYGNSYKSECAHASKLESRGHILFIKSIQNPMPILKRCNLFILSSIYEGLGLVLLEAIIQGVPVMSTDVVGPQGFMREYGGYLVSADTDGIYGGMLKFAEEGIEPLNVDFEEYNKRAVQEFEGLLQGKLR